MNAPQKTNSGNNENKFKWGAGNRPRTLTPWGQSMAAIRAQKQAASEPPKQEPPKQVQPNPSPLIIAQQKENTTPSVKLNWTKEEDDALTYYVEVYGANNWNTISSNIKGTTPRQCKERYEFYLKQNINTGPFTLEEDLRLMKLVQDIGSNWDKLKEYFQNRTSYSLKNHFSQLVSNFKVNKTVAKLQAELIMEKYNKKNQKQQQQQEEENLVQTTKETTSIGVQTMEVPDVQVYSFFIDLLAEFDTKFNKLRDLYKNE